MPTAIPTYPPTDHLPNHRRALCFFVMALQRHPEYEELRRDRRRMVKCVIEGRQFAVWELEWIYRDLTTKRTITQAVIRQDPDGTVSGPHICRQWTQDPRECFRTVQAGAGLPFSFHPGEPPEVLMKKIAKAREKFFRENRGVSKEMFLEIRDSKGRLVRPDFEKLEVSFQIYDLRMQGLKFREIIERCGMDGADTAYYRFRKVKGMVEGSTEVGSLGEFLGIGGR